MKETEGIPQKERYEIADLRVLMTTYYRRMQEKAKKYLAKETWDEDQADIEIALTKERLQEVNEESEQKMPLESWEYIGTGEVFHRKVLSFHGCMLHASAVMVDGYVYLFSADSGTGKSTHTALWKQYFGDKAVIVNDDKPTLRCIDGCWYVFGTPWSGKTNLNTNTRGKLGAIVFLERSKENWIREISVADAIPKYMKQTVRTAKNEERMELILKHMEEILVDTPLYQMGCNISEEAVKTAYEKIRRV